MKKDAAPLIQENIIVILITDPIPYEHLIAVDSEELVCSCACFRLIRCSFANLISRRVSYK